MARLNFLTVSSLLGAALSVLYIFFQFQVPMSMKQLNISLIKGQEKLISENDKAILELKKSIEKLHAQLASSNEDFKKKQKRLDEIQASVSKAEGNLDLVNKEFSKKLIEMEQLDISIKTAEFSEEEKKENQTQSIDYGVLIESQKIKIEDLKSELSGKIAEISQLGKTIGLSKQNTSSLEIKVETLTSQLREAKNRSEAIEIQLNNANEQLKELEKRTLAAEKNYSTEFQQGEEILPDTLMRNEAVSKLDGLVVSVEGFLTYDDRLNEINLSTRNGVKIPIRQDEFAGVLVGSCGLPISENMEERCLVNIKAELIADSRRFQLVGREIIDIAE